MLSVSVVTVVRNGAATIGACLDSVSAQSGPKEHIVVDGASDDGTVEIVRARGGSVARFISEPDAGLYEAMNKGIAVAGGEIVGTLNADDVYADASVLERVRRAFADPDVQACYGDLDYVDARHPSRVVRRWRSGSGTAGRIYRGWMPPHPTFFARRVVYEQCGVFNTALGTAADYELMLRFLLKHRVRAAYIPEVLVRMRSGGVSNRSLGHRLRAHRMDRLAWEVNGLKPRPWTLPFKPLRKIGQFFR
jgi:glycosyltransferase involved in cell wall biosynthesis